MTNVQGQTDQAGVVPIDAAPDAGLGRGFASLRVRNYRLYWSGQVVSLIGTWMQQVSLPWLVLALGGTALQLGIVAALQFLPMTLLAPFAGVFADRVDKRRALMATQLAAMLQAGLLFVLTATGSIEIPMVMALALMLGVISAADMPLRQALAADLVPRNMLANAIALNSMAFNGARVVGPALAGLFIALGGSFAGSQTAGVAVNFGVNTLTYSGALIGLMRMDPGQMRRPERREAAEAHPGVLSSLREGIAYSLRTPIVLWSLVLLGGVAAFGFNFQILVPLFAVDVLRVGADGYGALFATMGIGALLGSLTLAYMHHRHALPLMLGGGLVFALLEIALGLSRSVWLAFPLMLAIGYASMLMINTINATVQANVSDALRGRVMALYVTLFAGSVPLGGLFAGAVAEAWGAPSGFIAGAVLSLVIVAVVGWQLREAGREGRLGVTRIGTWQEREGASGAGRSRSAAR